MLSYPWVCKRSIFHLVFVSVHAKEKGAPIAAKLCQRRASTGRSRESHGAECRWCRVSRAKVWYWDYVCQLWSKDCCDMDCKVRHGFGNRSWTIWRWRGWKEDNMMTCFLWKRLIRCKVWTGNQGDHFLWKGCIPIKKASSDFMVAEAHHLLQSPSPMHAQLIWIWNALVWLPKLSIN